MFNFIVSSLLTGVITASGAQYLLNIESHSETVATAYTNNAIERFAEYDKLIPGIVKKDP